MKYYVVRLLTVLFVGTLWSCAGTGDALDPIEVDAGTIEDPIKDPKVDAGTPSTPVDASPGSPDSADPVPTATNIIITEIMANPAAVYDSAGEWFELFNPSAAGVDLQGWVFQDVSGKAHTIDSQLVIAAGQYLVLAKNADITKNGGVPASYAYGSSWNLSNGEDQILLYDTTGALVDAVEYAAGWTIESGASLSLKDLQWDNNKSSSWCSETKPWPGSAGDFGTPGTAALCQTSYVPPVVVDAGPAPTKADATVDSVSPDSTVDTIAPPPPPPGSIKVAAIQYGPGHYTFAMGCTDDNCGLAYYIKEAASNGAKYIVTPEYAFDQQYYEFFPANGVKPATDSNWGSNSLLGQLSQLADTENINLIVTLMTQGGTSAAPEFYNTHIVLDEQGKVVQTHKKYYLYSGEKKNLTAGENCCDLFDTPAGKAGLLICADINCIVYLDYKNQGSCTKAGLTKMNEFATGNARIVFFSSYWMAWKNPIWKAKAIMAKFAKHANAYVVGANIIDGNYHGGGVFAPDGTTIDLVDQKTSPGIAYGTIPPAP
jgi:predicted amidohydrolase